jgi:hypothetical protein
VVSAHSWVIRDGGQFVFWKTVSITPLTIGSMEPPQTKKQTIKNQKKKALSEHRLGTAKHVRLIEARKRNK